ncbi:hypothetical protein L1987_56881 [Smallanthus sonchifolius]|uniref:Uncharacterized protein n=1 Tax=Smallanthus sonchifolius TaxID=185202 RepID=A0ACB9DAZ3_9ASTR|nr:hypothetical protein L1987_56881 [Smallanthus sonchifolius]
MCDSTASSEDVISPNERIDLFSIGSSIDFGSCVSVGLQFIHKKFLSVGINPNELEAEEEWWIESVAFIEQQQKERLQQSVLEKGIPMCDTVIEEKVTRTNLDSEKFDMILNMMQQIVSSKRKWSSKEDEATQPPHDHDEEELKEYRNENIDDFDVKAADTPGPPSVEIVERPKRTIKPSSNVLSLYIVFKKKQRKKNDVFDMKKVKRMV